MNINPPAKILILWTSGNREVALNMVFMYALNSKQRLWWGEVTLLVWGPSAKLLAEDTELQSRLKEMEEAGIRVVACKQCADNYEITKLLEDLGIEVFYTGQMLTDWLKAGRSIMTI